MREERSKIKNLNVLLLLVGAFMAVTVAALALMNTGKANAKASDKVNVYVIKSYGVDFDGRYRHVSYTKNGLIKKVSSGYDWKIYKYDKKNRIKNAYFDYHGGYDNLKIKYKGSKITKIFIKRDDNRKAVSRFKYKKGKLRVIKRKGSEGRKTIKFKYNKKGHVILINVKSWNGRDNYRFKYDKSDNVKKYSGFYSRPSFQNGYDEKGRLAIRYINDSEYDLEYQYKKIKVKKSLLRKVEKQQWALLNNDPDGTLLWWR